MTHEEKTRLIAEFDGWEFVANHKDYPNGCFVIDRPSTIFPNQPAMIEDFGYSTEYDCLMPVWHKFRNAEILYLDESKPFTEMMGEYYRLSEKIKHAILFKEIEDFFNALAEAIEWYNTTKK